MPALNDVSIDKKEQILSGVNSLFEESVKASEKAKQEQQKLKEDLNKLETKKAEIDLKLTQTANDLKQAKEDEGKLKLKHAQELDAKQQAIDAEKTKLRASETKIDALNNNIKLQKKAIADQKKASDDKLLSTTTKLMDRMALATEQHKKGIQQKEDQIKQLKQDHVNEVSKHTAKVEALKKDLQGVREEVKIHKKRHEDAANEIKKLKSIEDNLNSQLKRSKDKRIGVQQERDGLKSKLKAKTEEAQRAAQDYVKASGEKDQIKQQLKQAKVDHQKEKALLEGKIMGLENKIKEERDKLTQKQADWSKRMAALRKTHESKDAKEIANLKQGRQFLIDQEKKAREELKEAERKLRACKAGRPTRLPPPLPGSSSYQPMMEPAPSYLFAKPVRQNKNYNNLRY